MFSPTSFRFPLFILRFLRSSFSWGGQLTFCWSSLSWGRQLTFCRSLAALLCCLSTGFTRPRRCAFRWSFTVFLFLDLVQLRGHCLSWGEHSKQRHLKMQMNLTMEALPNRLKCCKEVMKHYQSYTWWYVIKRKALWRKSYAVFSCGIHFKASPNMKTN